MTQQTTTTTAPSKTAVHFGGGAIGRGFVGQFLHESGYALVFVDVAAPLIHMFNSQPSYTVTEVGDGPDRPVQVDNYRAISSKTDEPAVVDAIAAADIVTCAVGPNILKFIAPLIAAGINARHARHPDRAPLVVIACENAINATTTLASFIRPALLPAVTAHEAALVRFANSAVDRIVPVQASSPASAISLDVKIEKFHEWCVESPPLTAAGATRPDLVGVHYVDDLAPYIERKLFTVNTGHATAAYYGRQAGHRFVHEAMADRRVRDRVTAVLAETATLIVAKHRIDQAEQARYVDMILRRFSNAVLADEVERVGRAPLRKLSRRERLVGPAVQLARLGYPVDALLGAIDVAFRFVDVADDAESAELANILRTVDHPAAVVQKVCGIRPDGRDVEPKEGEAAPSKEEAAAVADLFERIERIVGRVQDDLRAKDRQEQHGRVARDGVRSPVPGMHA